MQSSRLPSTPPEPEADSYLEVEGGRLEGIDVGLMDRNQWYQGRIRLRELCVQAPERETDLLLFLRVIYHAVNERAGRTLSTTSTDSTMSGPHEMSWPTTGQFAAGR